LEAPLSACLIPLAYPGSIPLAYPGSCTRARIPMERRAGCIRGYNPPRAHPGPELSGLMAPPWLAPPSLSLLSHGWCPTHIFCLVSCYQQAPSALLHGSDVLHCLVYANQAILCCGSVWPVGRLPFRAVCELGRVGWQGKPYRLSTQGAHRSLSRSGGTEQGQ
jgi:hypothetical protein